MKAHIPFLLWCNSKEAQAVKKDAYNLSEAYYSETVQNLLAIHFGS